MKTAAEDMPGLWVGTPSTESSPSIFSAALLFAGVLHLLIILTVGFEHPKVKSGPPNTRSLEVVVLRQAAPSDEKPETADAFAQVDRVGGGMENPEEIAAERALEPAPEALEPLAPTPVDPLPEPLDTAEPSPPEPIETKPLTATLEPPATEIALPEPEDHPWIEETTQEPEVIPDAEPFPPPPRVTASQILASRSLEIAELTARIEERTTAYSQRPRRKAISASTREYKYANYLEAWRRKVERIGNLNYPDEAKRRSIYGDLILHVAVRADGSLERVRVLRTSGFDVLDEAAVRIVELAAPFAPFSPEIKAETDLLDITRTWQFLSNNRLGWDN